jgi:hypothetical protein
MINRIVEFFKKQPTKAIQPDYSWVEKVAEKSVVNIRFLALEQRITTLEAKVDALSRPKDTRDWDAFKDKVQRDLAYHKNRMGRFPSDVQAAKEGDGE